MRNRVSCFIAVALIIVIASAAAYAAGVSPPPWTGAATTHAVTIPSTAGGTMLVPAAPAGGRQYLSIQHVTNPTSNAILWCSFGASSVPAAYTAGSFAYPSLGGRTWEGTFVPSDQLNCICSGASNCAVTYQAFPG
jgi:hypothetical protein